MWLKLGNVITDYQFHKRHSDAFHIMPNMKEKGSKSNVTKELILWSLGKQFKLTILLELRVHFKIQSFGETIRLVKAMVFPVVMYGCESWTVKKAERQTIDAFELWCWRRLLSPLDCKEIQPVHSKGDQSLVFTGRTDAEVETPILWPSHVKSWLIGKGPDAGRDWGQEEKGMTDDMAGWHHWLNAHEFGWTPGVGDRQGGLAWCDSWGRKESDTTERLNWTDSSSNFWVLFFF